MDVGGGVGRTCSHETITGRDGPPVRDAGAGGAAACALLAGTLRTSAPATGSGCDIASCSGRERAAEREASECR